MKAATALSTDRVRHRAGPLVAFSLRDPNAERSRANVARAAALIPVALSAATIGTSVASASCRFFFFLFFLAIAPASRSGS